MREGTVPVNPFGKTDKVKMNPPAGSPDLVEPAGPIDPTISIIALREPEGRLISVFSAYSLHYVGGVGGGHISADYYGMFCEALRGSRRDRPRTALRGHDGQRHQRRHQQRQLPLPGPRKAPYEQMRHVAEDVARKVDAALAKAAWKDGAELQALYREPPIALRRIDAELLAWAKDTESKAPGSPGADVVAVSYAGRIKRLAEAPATVLVPLQVLRIGDIGIGTTPCETFAEIGLEFKKRSPIAHSFMVELNHGYLGYLPSPRHFELGGYETWPGTNYLEPQASVKMLDALVEMATQLAPKSR
jgi:hypothetical protein